MDRAPFAPRPVLGPVHAVQRIGHRVAHKAIGTHFEQRRMAVLARTLDGTARRVVHRQRNSSRLPARRHVVAARVLDDVGHRRDALETPCPCRTGCSRREKSPAASRPTHNSASRGTPDVHRSFAEKTDAHFGRCPGTCLANARPGSEGYVTADDAVAAQEAFLASKRCMEPPLPLEQPSPSRTAPPSPRWRDPLDERLAMLAVGADDVVVVPSAPRARTTATASLFRCRGDRASDLGERVRLCGLFPLSAEMSSICRSIFRCSSVCGACGVLGDLGGGRHCVRCLHLLPGVIARAH